MFDIFGPYLAIFGGGVGFINCFGVSSNRLMTFVCEFCSTSALSCIFEFVVVGVGGISNDYFVSTQLHAVIRSVCPSRLKLYFKKQV